MRITRYTSLYITRPKAVDDLNWDEVVTKLSKSIETTDKFSVDGFGLHVLRAGRCRSAATVEHITAFGFDEDVGAPCLVAETDALLAQAGLASLRYSSFSHTPEKPAHRRIIPISRPMLPAEYPRLREHMIARFGISCNPNQSADVSRFWFSPSNQPGRKPEFFATAGKPYEVPEYGSSLPPTWGFNPDFLDIIPLPVPTADLPELRAAVERRMKKLARSRDPRELWLRKLLAGEPLADHGQRNDVVSRVCAILVFAFDPRTPPTAFLEILRPSLNRMIEAGSKLTETTVLRMVETALRKRTSRDRDTKHFVQSIIEANAAFRKA